MGKDRIRVIVADDTPVSRDLVRFFLESEGFEVAGDTSRSDELVMLAISKHPDAIVLDESLAVVNGMQTIPLLRRAAPGAAIVVYATGWLEGHEEGEPADARVSLRDGLALKELAETLRRLCGPRPATLAGTRPRKDVPAPPIRVLEPGPPEEPEVARVRRRTGPLRLTAVIAALALMALGVYALARGPRETAPPGAAFPTVSPTPSPELSPEPDTEVRGAQSKHLATARRVLDQLVRATKKGTFKQVTRAARTLLLERFAATQAGRSVEQLDARIAARVTPLVLRVPQRTAWALVGMLGPILPDVEIGDP